MCTFGCTYLKQLNVVNSGNVHHVLKRHLQQLKILLRFKSMRVCLQKGREEDTELLDKVLLSLTSGIKGNLQIHIWWDHVDELFHDLHVEDATRQQRQT